MLPIGLISTKNSLLTSSKRLVYGHGLINIGATVKFDMYSHFSLQYEHAGMQHLGPATQET